MGANLPLQFVNSTFAELAVDQSTGALSPGGILGGAGGVFDMAVTVGEGNVLDILFLCAASHANGGRSGFFRIYVGPQGGPYNATRSAAFYAAANNATGDVGVKTRTAPLTAGNYRVQIYWYTDGGPGNLSCRPVVALTSESASLTVRELRL